MKRIIVACLAISILLGIYGKTKIKTNSLSEQVAVTIKWDTDNKSDSVQLKRESPVAVAPRTDNQNPLTATTQVYAAENHPSDEAIIRGKKNGDILWRVYTLESSKGKNDGCRLSGKFNGFGYRQNSREHICFEYLEEVVNYVDTWFEEKLQTHDLATTLCGYNLGFQSAYLQDCVAGSKEYPYYRNYMSL